MRRIDPARREGEWDGGEREAGRGREREAGRGRERWWDEERGRSEIVDILIVGRTKHRELLHTYRQKGVILTMSVLNMSKTTTSAAMAEVTLERRAEMSLMI